MLYYIILYYTLLYYTILYYTILYYTILYYTILSTDSRILLPLLFFVLVLSGFCFVLSCLLFSSLPYSFFLFSPSPPLSCSLFSSLISLPFPFQLYSVLFYSTVFSSLPFSRIRYIPSFPSLISSSTLLYLITIAARTL